MNEITKSVLRRVNDEQFKISISKKRGEMQITEAELKAIIADLRHWPKAYPFMIDGITVKILWNEDARLLAAR